MQRRPVTGGTGRLRGVRVLVTRPESAAGRLADAFVAEDAVAVRVPAIEIAPVEDRRSAERLGARLADVEVAVFTSVNAVDGFFGLVPSGAGARLPPAVLAVGRATANALRSRAAVHVHTPSERFDSEGLLACAELDARCVAGRLVAVVKGEGGRNLLETELIRRGAEVIEANVYRRRSPERLAEMLGDLRESIDIVTVASAEALENLAGAASWIAPWLSRRIVVAVSERVAGVARTLNLSRVVVAGGADPASIVEAAVRALPEADRPRRRLRAESIRWCGSAPRVGLGGDASAVRASSANVMPAVAHRGSGWPEAQPAIAPRPELDCATLVRPARAPAPWREAIGPARRWMRRRRLAQIGFAEGVSRYRLQATPSDCATLVGPTPTLAARCEVVRPA